MECPVCGKYCFDEEYDICPICGWENDGVQADDHNYAGGANHLSVNEARIEFFLLKEKSVREEVIRCREAYEEECLEIWKRYAGINYVKFPEKRKQERDDFREARKKYIDTLNHILQSML